MSLKKERRETESSVCILIKLYFDWLNDWKWLEMVCFTCQHLHTATGKMSLILLRKKSPWGGLLSIFLYSEHLCKYPKTLFNDQDKNMSFFQYNSGRQHKTSPKPRWIQVPAITNITKNKSKQKISNYYKGCWVKHASVRKYKNVTLWKGPCKRWEHMQPL